MAQKINWLQIDTEKIPKNRYGEPFRVVLGGKEYEDYLDAVYSSRLITKNIDAETYEIKKKEGSGFSKVILWNPDTKEVTYGEIGGHSHENIETLNKITSVQGSLRYDGDVVITDKNISNYSNSDKNFVHDQAIASKVWRIEHGLRKEVSVTIKDSAGTGVMGRVSVNNGHLVVIEFNSPFTGKAVLN